MGGSSIVTIRPTMTRSPASDPSGPGVAVGSGARPAGHDGDVRGFVPAKTQPLTRASTKSVADAERNCLRDPDMRHLVQGSSAAIEAALCMGGPRSPDRYLLRGSEEAGLFNPRSERERAAPRSRPSPAERATALSRRRPRDAVAPWQGPPRTMLCHTERRGPGRRQTQRARSGSRGRR